MLNDDDIIEQMIYRQEMYAEEMADRHHEHMMQTDFEYFLDHSSFIEYSDARLKFAKELRVNGWHDKPEDLL